MITDWTVILLVAVEQCKIAVKFIVSHDIWVLEQKNTKLRCKMYGFWPSPFLRRVAAKFHNNSYKIDEANIQPFWPVGPDL